MTSRTQYRSVFRRCDTLYAAAGYGSRNSEVIFFGIATSQCPAARSPLVFLPSRALLAARGERTGPVRGAAAECQRAAAGGHRRPCPPRRRRRRLLRRVRRPPAELHRLDHRRLCPQVQRRHSAWGHPGRARLRLARSSAPHRYGWGSRPASRSSLTRRTATQSWCPGAARRYRAASGRRRPTRWTCSWLMGCATRCASASHASSGYTPSCCASCLGFRCRRCRRSAGLTACERRAVLAASLLATLLPPGAGSRRWAEGVALRLTAQWEA